MLRSILIQPKAMLAIKMPNLLFPGFYFTVVVILAMDNCLRGAEKRIILRPENSERMQHSIPNERANPYDVVDVLGEKIENG